MSDVDFKVIENIKKSHRQIASEIIDLEVSAQGLRIEKRLLEEKLAKIEEYCKPYTEFTWAAQIIAIIKGCDSTEGEDE